MHYILKLVDLLIQLILILSISKFLLDKSFINNLGSLGKFLTNKDSGLLYMFMITIVYQILRFVLSFVVR